MFFNYFIEKKLIIYAILIFVCFIFKYIRVNSNYKKNMLII